MLLSLQYELFKSLQSVKALVQPLDLVFILCEMKLSSKVKSVMALRKMLNLLSHLQTYTKHGAATRGVFTTHESVEKEYVCAIGHFFG